MFENLPEVKTFPIESFKDHRGEINPLWKENRHTPLFKETRLSHSYRDVLRGLHMDAWNSKLFIPIQGQIYLVVVSPEGVYDWTILSSNRKVAVLVPQGYLNGTFCLSGECILLYLWSHEYLPPEQQETVRWDDPDLNIQWPHNAPILSERDKNGRSWKEICEIHRKKGLLLQGRI